MHLITINFRDAYMKNQPHSVSDNEFAWFENTSTGTQTDANQPPPSMSEEATGNSSPSPQQRHIPTHSKRVATSQAYTQRSEQARLQQPLPRPTFYNFQILAAIGNHRSTRLY